MISKTWILPALLIGSLLMSGCGDKGPFKIVFISGSNEYFSDISLPEYKKYLEKNYEGIQITLLQGDGEYNARNEFTNIDGLGALEDCDLLLTFTRRMTLPPEQIGRIRKYVESGGPVVALRTASHGYQDWLEFDKEVLGGNYHGHYPGSPERGGHDAPGDRYVKGGPTGPTQRVTVNPDVKDHPVLDGVVDFSSRYSLYLTSPVADNALILLMGTIPTGESDPVAWVRSYKGARIVYISIGGLQDWENSTFLRLVTNAVFWAANRKVPPKMTACFEQRPQPKGKIELSARTRVESEKGSDVWQEKVIAKELHVGETAIIICDVWDKHWCRGATERCEQLARKMSPVVNKAREKGIQIVHAPSSTMPFYADYPQRHRMMAAREAAKPEPLDIPDRPLPIDDSDGGCDTDDDSYSAWTRQSVHIEIGEYDGISDDGNEIYNFFKDQGIKRVIMMGVHTNMCVLNRSFAIKQMRRWGFDCLLVRDLTDAMYDPKDAPYVSHDEGTELVVQHIEKYWCPTVLSKDLMKALDDISGD